MAVGRRRIVVLPGQFSPHVAVGNLSVIIKNRNEMRPTRPAPADGNFPSLLAGFANTRKNTISESGVLIQMTTDLFGVCELPLRHITISLLLLLSSSVSALSPLKLSNSLNCGSLSHRLKQIRSNAFVSPNPPAFAAARFCACPNRLQRRISSRTLDDAPGRRRVNSRTATTMSGGVVNLLGQDVVSFLATSVVVVPLCKQLNISPVLGFLGAGLVSAL